MKFVDKAIGFLIGLAVLGIVVPEITGITGEGGVLAGTAAGTVLDLAPLLIVVALIYIFYRQGK